MVMAALAMPAVADEVDDLILDLNGTDPEDRINAAIALGNISDSRAIEPLIETLKDEDENVRDAAAKSLIDIGKPAVGPLIEALKDDDENVRALSAAALGDIGDTRAVDPLIENLKDEKVYVRAVTAFVLGYIGDPRAVDPLIAALNDVDSNVRQAAATGLILLSDEALRLDPEDADAWNNKGSA